MFGLGHANEFRVDYAPATLLIVASLLKIAGI
jgi:hypothetical protein